MAGMNASQAEFRAAKEPTGPESISVLSLLRGHQFDPFERWTRIRRDHGPVAHYHYGIFNNFFISSAEGAKRVFQDNVGNYTKEHTSYKMVRRLVGNGLLTSEGSFWLRQRRLAQPAFHRERIARMAGPMTAAALETAQRWEAKAASGETVSMMNEMSNLTLKVVGDALFGAAVSAQATTVAESWEVLSQQMVERFSRLRLLPPILPTKYDREFRRAREKMFSVVDEIIAGKRAHGESDDLLSMFMQARDEDTGEQMSDAQLRHEVTTMLLAGHETTAVVLAWVWALLAHYPAVAQKLRDELDRVLAGRTPTAADVSQLPYAKSVIEEAMRLYPPVYILQRHVRENDVVCGFRVYKGGSVVISPLILHRHPSYWERPDDFLPERWMDSAAENQRPRFSYIPFSGGPRQCIGDNFSRLESILLLATLAQRFEPVPVRAELPKPEFLVLARPAGGVPMILRRRSAAGRPRQGLGVAAPSAG